MVKKDDLVVIDSHLWIEFFSRKDNEETRELARLIRQGRSALVGPVLYEVLIGPRREEQRQYLRSRLRALYLLATTEGIWLRAVELGCLPGVPKRKVPASDVLIAAHCEINNVALFTRDSHFEAFPKLRRHRA